MSVTFTKLFSSITESTIWCEDAEVRVVWITMLAMADKMGRVWGSIPGLANRARVSIEKTEESLTKFLSPDGYSRTKEFEGRRIEIIDGGWRLLNHDKYRKLRDDDERREYKKHWIANKRSEVVDNVDNVDNVDKSRPPYTQAEANTEAEAITTTTMSELPKNGSSPRVPFEEIVALYNSKLPDLPRLAKLTPARQGIIRQRWTEDLPSLDAWGRYFDFVKQSDFLMGRTKPTEGRKPFRADLMWLSKAENICKVMERKYHA